MPAAVYPERVYDLRRPSSSLDDAEGRGYGRMAVIEKGHDMEGWSGRRVHDAVCLAFDDVVGRRFGTRAGGVKSSPNASANNRE